MNTKLPQKPEAGVVILAKTQEMCETVNWALRNRQVADR